MSQFLLIHGVSWLICGFNKTSFWNNGDPKDCAALHDSSRISRKDFVDFVAHYWVKLTDFLKAHIFFGANASSSCSDKIFFVLDKTEIVQDKIFVHGWKLHFLLSTVMQNEYLLLKIDFQSGNFVLNDFWKQKMYFLTVDKIFILDSFSFVKDKKCFVQAEGRGIRMIRTL